MSDDLPREAERLLSTAPGDFVDERRRLARTLHADGRREDAEAVATLRKPPAVVLAVNRAVRDRPRAAQDAVAAARRLARVQLSGKRAAYDEAAGDLERSLDLVAEVALAHLARGERGATEAMRRRVYDLLRAAVADETMRERLVRGTLVEEVRATGFEAFAGMPLPTSTTRERGRRAPDGEDARERARRRELQQRIADARHVLRDAERDLREAERRRDRAAKDLAELEGQADEP